MSENDYAPGLIEAMEHATAEWGALGVAKYLLDVYPGIREPLLAPEATGPKEPTR